MKVRTGIDRLMLALRGNAIVVRNIHCRRAAVLAASRTHTRPPSQDPSLMLRCKPRYAPSFLAPKRHACIFGRSFFLGAASPRRKSNRLKSRPVRSAAAPWPLCGVLSPRVGRPSSFPLNVGGLRCELRTETSHPIRLRLETSRRDRFPG